MGTLLGMARLGANRWALMVGVASTFSVGCTSGVPPAPAAVPPGKTPSSPPVTDAGRPHVDEFTRILPHIPDAVRERLTEPVPLAWQWAEADFDAPTRQRLGALGAVSRFIEAANAVSTSSCPLVDRRVSWNDVPEWWRPEATRAALSSFRANPENEQHVAGLSGLWLNCDEPPCLLVTSAAEANRHAQPGTDGVIRDDPAFLWATMEMQSLAPLDGQLHVESAGVRILVWVAHGRLPEGVVEQPRRPCPLGSAETRRKLELLEAIHTQPGARDAAPWARELIADLSQKVRW